MATTEMLNCLCLFHIVDGLCAGLCHFSGPSRAAVIYAEKADDPIHIYDPQDLLRGHEPKLKKLYLNSDEWRKADLKLEGLQPDTIYPERDIQLTGLISSGGRSCCISYQMWFTEHHPDICSIGPTERWLEHAACLLSHDMASQGAFLVGTSRYVLREYSTHAVRDYMRDELNVKFGWDVQLEVYSILDTVVGISKTPEEGMTPRGVLVFVDPAFLRDVHYLVRFPLLERPKLKDHKHVRKLLLAVEDSDRKLVSDGVSIVGISTGHMPECRITADYRGGYGFMRLAGNPVCSFSDGSFLSSTRKPKLVHLEEALIGSMEIDPSITHVLFKIISDIAAKACDHRHGCSIVLDFNNPCIKIAGQRLDPPPDLREERFLDLAKSLSKIDGALHIGTDLRLHAFACLLDGLAVPGESRARGARFNSALRFTAKHENLIVIVVSSDRPVSVIQGGVELSAQCEWTPFTECFSTIPTLEDWIKSA